MIYLVISALPLRHGTEGNSMSGHFALASFPLI